MRWHFQAPKVSRWISFILHVIAECGGREVRGGQGPIWCQQQKAQGAFEAETRAAAALKG